ncbi:MAG TPA: hypothetical protein VIO11_01385, partial [Candidatus Methanoperedens sp.]
MYRAIGIDGMILRIFEIDIYTGNVLSRKMSPLTISRMFIFLAFIIGISISGCLDNPLQKSPEIPSSAFNSDDHSRIEGLIAKLNESENEINDLKNKMAAQENKIEELENKKKSMQKELEEMRAAFNNKVDLPKPSNRSLIPRTPFKIEIWFGETPVIWTFRE